MEGGKRKKLKRFLKKLQKKHSPKFAKSLYQSDVNLTTARTDPSWETIQLKRTGQRSRLTMLEYQILPENLPAIFRGFAVLGVVLCVVGFFITFISGAAQAPRKNDDE